VIGSDSYFNSPTQYGVLVHPFTIILAMKQRNFIPETVYGGPFLSKRFLILFFFLIDFFFFLVLEFIFCFSDCLQMRFVWGWVGLGWIRIRIRGLLAYRVRFRCLSVHIIGQKAWRCFLACMVFYLIYYLFISEIIQTQV
jgi:hypothetical protein